MKIPLITSLPLVLALERQQTLVFGTGANYLD